MNGFWIGIEDSTGTAVGDGYIYTATRWSYTPQLDKIGGFSFAMPAADPRAQYLDYGRVVVCYGVRGGAVVQRGSGIVQQMKHVVDTSGRVMLQVGGPNLLQEWADTLVWRKFQANLTRTAEEIHMLRSATSGSGTVEYWPFAYDGSTSAGGFGYGSYDWAGNDDFLYLRYHTPVTAFIFTLADVNSNGDAGTLQVQYFDGAQWVNYSGVTDGTAVAGVPMKQSGTVSWALTGRERLVLHNGAHSYWVRIIPTVGITDVEYNEIQVRDVTAEVGAFDAVGALVSGWTVLGTAADDLLLADVRGESALEVARKVVAYGRGAGTTQGHFRYFGGRQVQWFARNDVTEGDSGVLAVGAGAADFGYGDDVAIITDITVEGDSSEQVTTIYPVGGGAGDSAITLQMLVDEGYTLPSGYSFVSKSGGFPNQPTFYGIKNDALATSLGRQIERFVPFRDVASVNGAGATRHAALKLLEKSLVWLSERLTVQKVYKVKLAGLESNQVTVGNTLRVIYMGVDTSGDLFLQIDERFYILAADIEIAADGVEKLGLTISNVLRQPQTDEDVVAELYAEGRDTWRANQPVSSANVNGLVGGLPD